MFSISIEKLFSRKYLYIYIYSSLHNEKSSMSKLEKQNDKSFIFFKLN